MRNTIEGKIWSDKEVVPKVGFNEIIGKRRILLGKNICFCKVSRFLLFN